MQYIIEFNADRSLVFDMFDNDIVNMHVGLLNSIKGDKEFKEHGVFGTYDSILDPHVRILQAKETLKNKMGIDITWPADATEITRELLNELHLDFHRITKNNELSSAIPIFNVINHDIHLLERLITQRGSDAHYVIIAKETGKPEPRRSLNTYRNGPMLVWGHHNNYIQQFKAQYIENMPNIMLYLGYTTIGKHLWHCVTDNDIEAVASGHISPQTTMSTEVIVRYQPPWESHKSQEAINRYNDSCTTQIIKWLMDKALLDRIDINDKRHFINEQPVLGQICEEQRNLTEYDLWQLFRHYKIIDTRYKG